MRDVLLAGSQDGQRRALSEIATELRLLGGTLDRGLSGPALNGGAIDLVEAVLDKYFRANGRWPGFVDIGTNAFYDVYDWHLRQRQPIHIIRLAEQRWAIQFRFTQLVLRWELPDQNHVGIPY